MGTSQRSVDRGTERGRETVNAMARECRAARRSRGLSQRFVADEARVSKSWMSMFERGAIANPGLVTLSRVLAVVGLDFVGRTFPSNAHSPRDVGHARLLTRFARLLDVRLLWRLEVPLPRVGDLRAWDAIVAASDRSWRYGVEAETRPSDGQDLARRLMLKQRDGGMDGVLLLLPDTRTTRAFLQQFGPLLAHDFPVDGRTALARLARGEDPGRSAIIVC